MKLEDILEKEDPTKSEQAVLAKAFWQLVKKYELSHDEVTILFGRNFDPKTLSKHRQSNSLPDGHDILCRVIHVLGIHNSLRMIYPHNPSLVYSWMRHKDNMLKGFSPIELVRSSGVKSLSALIFLRNFLDYKRTAL